MPVPALKEAMTATKYAGLMRTLWNRQTHVGETLFECTRRYSGDEGLSEELCDRKNALVAADLLNV